MYHHHHGHHTRSYIVIEELGSSLKNMTNPAPPQGQKSPPHTLHISSRMSTKELVSMRKNTAEVANPAPPVGQKSLSTNCKSGQNAIINNFNCAILFKIAFHWKSNTLFQITGHNKLLYISRLAKINNTYLQSLASSSYPLSTFNQTRGSYTLRGDYQDTAFLPPSYYSTKSRNLQQRTSYLTTGYVNFKKTPAQRVRCYICA